MRWNDEAQASVRGFSLAKRSSKGKSDNLVKRSLRPLLEKAGLPPLTFHKLRHTFATYQLAAGERPKVVQEILGHSSTKTTMDTYFARNTRDARGGCRTLAETPFRPYSHRAPVRRRKRQSEQRGTARKISPFAGELGARSAGLEPATF